MIISLHLPKTAGTSFFSSLEQHFGNKLLRDYSDMPVNTPPYQRNKAAENLRESYNKNGLPDVECIHGHFLPMKYSTLADINRLTFITWMRHPVERLLSHYFFWKENSCIAKPELMLHKRMMDESWSIERFCLGTELRNLYAQFLWNFPIERFNFIGITEFYDEDIKYFSHKYLQTNFVNIQKLNIGTQERSSYQVSASFRKAIEVYHAEDMLLYQHALKKRMNRHHTLFNDE